MPKKPSGLGRGLDDLLEDNTLSKRTGRPLVESRGEVTPSNNTPSNINTSVYEVKTKTLYDTKPRTRSVKANFKNKSN